MKRLQLIEIHDQGWCPHAIRDAVTDYLQFAIAATKPYSAMVPVLAGALRRTATREVLDLCSGGGGPWPWLLPVLLDHGVTVSVCLTDKYPNLGIVDQSNGLAHPALSYHSQPVDATRVPGELSGFRTMFTAYHHFPPEQALEVLNDAIRRRQGIAVFEVVSRSAVAMGFALLIPPMVLLLTPWIRPFRWSRLFWTYVIPLVPIITLFDALVSCLRAYSVTELRELTEKLGTAGYHWEIGTVRIETVPIPITYLIGVPLERTIQGHATI